MTLIFPIEQSFAQYAALVARVVHVPAAGAVQPQALIPQERRAPRKAA